MVKESSCLGCGSRFTSQPSNSSGKYCSYDCMKIHRARLSGSDGMHFRKLLLRAGVHHENSLMRVYAIVRNASESERMVIMRDILMEHDAVKAEIDRISAGLTIDERTRITIECERLERVLKQRPPRITMQCDTCGKMIPSDSGLCFSCGEPVGYTITKPPETEP